MPAITVDDISVLPRIAPPDPLVARAPFVDPNQSGSCALSW
jgi:hypothetical protein